MRETDLVTELYEEFTSFYDDSHVEREALLGTDLRPDLMVYVDERDVLLVAEAKSSRSIENDRRSFEQLNQYLKHSEASFGAYLTPNTRYVFKEAEFDGLQFEVSTGGLPDGPNGLEERRSFESFDEILFCYEHARRIYSKQTGDKLSPVDLLQELQRLVVAENTGHELSPQTADFENQLMDLDDVVQNEIPFFNPGYSERALNRSRIVQGVFHGYSLIETNEDVLERFISEVPSRFGKQSQHGTPSASAKYLVNQLDIQAGDCVLDPAMGWGNVLREVSKTQSEASCTGIEISSRIAQTASAFNTILDVDISIRVADGIKSAYQDSFLNSAFDYVFLDPPIGKQVTSDDLPTELQDWTDTNIEDVFLFASLEYLNEGGVLTAIIPQRLLDRKNSQRLWDELLDNYQIESIVEVDQGSFYPSVSADLAVLQVRKPVSDEIAPTDFILLDEFKGAEQGSTEPETKQRFELNLATESPPRILVPSRVATRREVSRSLEDVYSELIPLEDVVSDIRKGIRVPEEKLTSKDGLQYLQISDVTGESDSMRFVDESEHEGLLTVSSSDLLISAAGSVDVSYVPEHRVVPHSNWVILRFDSHAKAKVYQSFFSTELGTDLLESLSTGQTISHLTVENLRDVRIPDFDDVDALAAQLSDFNELQNGRVDEGTASQIEAILHQGEQ